MIEYIQNAKTIYIVTHIRPDGDAIGSAFALKLALNNMGKSAKVIMSSYSKRFDFLEEVADYVDKVSEDKYDLLICTDCSDIRRLDIFQEDFLKAKHIIVFDHHKFSKIECDDRIVDEISPAACEIVYDFFVENNIEITPKIADFLYLGLLTDTGSFNYERTTSKTYKIAATLIERNANFAYICKKMNDTMPENRMKLMLYTLNNMKTFFNGRLRVSVVTQKVLDEYGVDKEDAEGMTNYLRMIENTELAVYIREVEDGFKVSLRSAEFVDCAEFAAEFDGGGHIRAAGFNTLNVEETIQKIVEKMEEVFKN